MNDSRLRDAVLHKAMENATKVSISWGDENLSNILMFLDKGWSLKEDLLGGKSAFRA